MSSSYTIPELELINITPSGPQRKCIITGKIADKADLIRYVKEQSQLHWTRQAKLDPEYARPTTAHTLMFLIGMPVFAGRGLRPL